MLCRWVWNLLVSADQLINTLMGGDPDETISSRAGKARRAGKWWGRWVCRVLDWFDPGHCDRVIEPDEGEDAAWFRAGSG